LVPLGRTLSISSYKGGVGKSPITVNVAARLVERNFKLAVVTDDGIFRGMRDEGRTPPPENSVRYLRDIWLSAHV